MKLTETMVQYIGQVLYQMSAIAKLAGNSGPVRHEPVAYVPAEKVGQSPKYIWEYGPLTFSSGLSEMIGLTRCWPVGQRVMTGEVTIAGQLTIKWSDTDLPEEFDLEAFEAVLFRASERIRSIASTKRQEMKRYQDDKAAEAAAEERRQIREASDALLDWLRVTGDRT